MTELFADVIATLQRPSALASANMLRFNAVINWASSRVQRTQLLLGRLALNSFALPRAAAFFACMSTTIEVGTANSPTLWLLLTALMANGR